MSLFLHDRCTKNANCIFDRFKKNANQHHLAYYISTYIRIFYYLYAGTVVDSFRNQNIRKNYLKNISWK